MNGGLWTAVTVIYLLGLVAAAIVGRARGNVGLAVTMSATVGPGIGLIAFLLEMDERERGLSVSYPVPAGRQPKQP